MSTHCILPQYEVNTTLKCTLRLPSETTSNILTDIPLDTALVLHIDTIGKVHATLLQ
jgi:hypothetical protein